MTEDALQKIRLKDDFYRDGFGKVIVSIVFVGLSIIALIATSLYLVFSKPAPVVFSTGKDWRVIPAVPLNQPYLKTPDLVQWVSTVLPKLFMYDFIHYQEQLKDNKKYFTEDGWKIFLSLLDRYASFSIVNKGKLFISSGADNAPFLVNQGLLNGRYVWWVQIPINMNYSNGYAQTVALRVLIVRVPTLDNLYGVEIDNIILTGDQKTTRSG